ncbi:hypothetical protein [Halorussus halophilus]|uniref:hypothetical protein n=1 Tax=Halorussus halophilus TaxID=2650975 RepID=UPI0013016469|nr:hypothetical protein [Halorussus halophilus]
MSRTAIVCVFCLLLAGCTAPAANPTTNAVGNGAPPDANDPVETTTVPSDSNATTQSGESGYDIPVSGGSLPIDHERTFGRTIGLLGANASPPTVLLVKSPEELASPSGPNGGSGSGQSTTSRTFLGVMGVGQDSGGGERDDGESDDGDDSRPTGITVAAYVPSAYSVVVNERLTAPRYERSLERTLAHEYTHTVQFQRDAFTRLQRALSLRDDYSRDTYLVYLGVVEGAGVYTEVAYDREYLGGRGSPTISNAQYRNAPSAAQYSLARYYFGYRYLDARLDSPSGLETVYDDPPRTTEELLHNLTPGSEPPKPLSVSTAFTDDRSVGLADTNGELMTRIFLATELNASRASSGADGWGNDKVVPVEGPNRSFVWATRWDSPAEANEFETTLTEYLAARGEQSGDIWLDGPLRFRVVRVSDESVVLLAGDESFVRNSSASGSDSTVEVRTE